VVPHFRKYKSDGPQLEGESGPYWEVSLSYTRRRGGVSSYFQLVEGEVLEVELEETEETGHTILCAHFRAAPTGIQAGYHHPRLQLRITFESFFMLRYNLS